MSGTGRGWTTFSDLCSVQDHAKAKFQDSLDIIMIIIIINILHNRPVIYNIMYECQ